MAGREGPPGTWCSDLNSPPPSPAAGACGGEGGQTLGNDDDSIIGACGGLGQTNAEQMPKEEGRRIGTLRHIDTPKQRETAVA